MSDGNDEEHGRPGNEGVNEDVRSEGDEGRRTADATPPIADDARPEQSSHQRLRTTLAFPLTVPGPAVRSALPRQ